MKNCKIPFLICLISAVGLFIGGFFVPPTGVIDGSILSAAGILLAFAAIGQIPIILQSSKSAKITAGGQTIEITGHKSEHETDH